mgnify:FL=1|tara:strand:+ start:159 stop:467 length:309 start_codon:yes stop_codon:yes gene_type:complete
MKATKKTQSSNKELPNPFDKEVPIKKAYAIYLSPEALTEYRIVKTFTHPSNETEDSRWLVATKRMSIDLSNKYDLTELSREDVNYKSFIVSCSNDWKQYYTH